MHCDHCLAPAPAVGDAVLARWALFVDRTAVCPECLDQHFRELVGYEVADEPVIVEEAKQP